MARLKYSQLTERFESKIDHNGPIPKHCPWLGPCHIWKGGINSGDGYGRISVGSRKRGDFAVRLAHRVAWLLEHGRWPEPCALHKCDNRACVRVDHLFEGTIADNFADMVAKGRQAKGELNGMAKFRAADIVAIRHEVGMRIRSQRTIAKKWGVSPATISLIVAKKHWKHVV